MSAVQHAGSSDAAGRELAQDIANDQARAERVAIARRRQASLRNFGIRLVSLAIFLGVWQIAAMNVDPVLFTSPWKVAVAAVGMIGSEIGRAHV